MHANTKQLMLNIRTTRELRSALIERAALMHIKPTELVRFSIAQMLATPMGVLPNEQAANQAKA